MIIKIKVDKKNPLGATIRKFLPSLNLKQGPWVAGGAARLLAENITDLKSDIDVYFPSEKNMKRIRGRFAIGWLKVNSFNSYIDIHQTNLDNQYKFQLHTKFYSENLEELFEGFDFSVCAFATDGKIVYGDSRGFEDLKLRKLRLMNKPKNPEPYRVIKYISKGFTPEPGVVAELLGLNNDNQDLPDFSYPYE